ncbi:hypothetical protein MFRU_003g02920 [Monilinia fructicola]|nr:hypothetical protein MFRU_003g02920 [Monilinia fructicola]
MVSPHLLALLAITTAITSISAAPAPAHQSSPKDLLLSGLPKGIDPAKLIPERPGLQKRGRDQNYFRSALPGCSDDDDPSYAIGNSAYQDGKGMLSDSGMCDNKKYTGGWHCWTDMHYGMVQIEYSDGTNTGGTIDCKSTSQCALQSISLNQSCTSNTASHDNAVQFSLETKLDEVKQTKWSVGWRLFLDA